MCKLFGVTSTIGWERKTLQATLNAAQAAFGQSEKDGFGFAVRTSRGIYSEKYTSPKSFLGIGSGRKGLANFASIRSGVDYDTETKGKLSKLTGGLIVHGRTSTNAGGILNTHPFIRKGWALAHNGIVDYSGPDRKTTGTCDSEDILNAFVYGGGLSELEENFSGYAALLVLPPEGGFIAYRDKRASLCVARIESEVESYAFATRQDHLSQILKKAGVKHSAPVGLLDEHAIIVKPDGGFEVEEHQGPSHRYSTASEVSATGITNGGATYSAASRYSHTAQRSRVGFAAQKSQQSEFPNIDGNGHSSVTVK